MIPQFHPELHVMTVKVWERKETLKTMWEQNYRMVYQEQVTNNKIYMVFRKIQFQCAFPSNEARDRYWEVRQKLNEISEEARASLCDSSETVDT